MHFCKNEMLASRFLLILIRLAQIRKECYHQHNGIAISNGEA